jgi:hypothetical protein
LTETCYVLQVPRSDDVYVIGQYEEGTHQGRWFIAQIPRTALELPLSEQTALTQILEPNYATPIEALAHVVEATSALREVAGSPFAG